MPSVIQLKSGQTETVFDLPGMLYLVEQYMGKINEKLGTDYQLFNYHARFFRCGPRDAKAHAEDYCGQHHSNARFSVFIHVQFPPDPDQKNGLFQFPRLLRRECLIPPGQLTNPDCWFAGTQAAAQTSRG